MKIHKRQIAGINVLAYNDSGADWVVESIEYGTMRFDQRLFTLKAALEFYVRLYAEENDIYIPANNQPTTGTNAHTQSKQR